MTIVKNDASNVVAVVLTNPIHRVLGGFTVTKHVTGETAGYVAGSTFTVSYTCSDGTVGTLTLKDGQTKGVTGLPLLTTCTLSETPKPATKDASYAWGTADVGSVRARHHRGQRRRQHGRGGPDQPAGAGAGWLHRHQARDG